MAKNGSKDTSNTPGNEELLGQEGEKTFHDRVVDLEKDIVALKADNKQSKVWVLNAFKKMYLQVKALEAHSHNSHGTAVIPVSQAETLVDAGEGIGKSQNESNTKNNQ